MSNNSFIGIAGNIGVGKTTFTSFLAKELNFREVYESVADNPYLPDFYKDMNRWSFNLQIYFLHHRFSSIMDFKNSDQGIIQDRTIYEDVEIFSKNLYQMNFMDKRDWDTYSELFKNMTSFLKAPDLIIYLKADLDVILNRISHRNREYESDIDPDYINQLNILYDEWIEKIDWTKILVIDTNEFNIFENKEKFNSIILQVKNQLSNG